MANDKYERLWGPVYHREWTSIEVRSLSWGARELWVALSTRTRSAGSAPDSKRGYYASSAALAEDLARVGKDGVIRPINVRTVGRYMKELKNAGLVEVRRNTGAPYICLLVPPSIRPTEKTDKPVDNLRKTNGKNTSDVRSIGQKTASDRTRMDVRCTDPQKDPQIHNSSSDYETKVERMAESLSIYHRVGNVPTKEFDAYKSWAQVAMAVPQALRPMFRSSNKGIESQEYDELIREAGKRACLKLHPDEIKMVGN